MLRFTAKRMEVYVIQTFLETVSLGSAYIYEAKWRRHVGDLCLCNVLV